MGGPNNNSLSMRTKINHRHWMVVITSFYASLVGNDAFEKQYINNLQNKFCYILEIWITVLSKQFRARQQRLVCDVCSCECHRARFLLFEELVIFQ